MPCTPCLRQDAAAPGRRTGRSTFRPAFTAAVLAVCGMFLALAAPAAQKSAEKQKGPSAGPYEKRTVEGWTVHVGEPLLEDHPELADQAIRILSNQLFDIRRTLPDRAVERLQEVPIWLQYRCGDIACASYHPSPRWLEQHGYNPDKAGAVDIGHAEHFAGWTTQQHSMVLHELAHAYHHQVLGYDHEGIKEAYQRAKDAGLYDSVLQWRGQRQQHYALQNGQEFFAEMTEAYFGVNDFYPFVRAELQDYDPETAALVRQLWSSDSAGSDGGGSSGSEK